MIRFPKERDPQTGLIIKSDKKKIELFNKWELSVNVRKFIIGTSLFNISYKLAAFYLLNHHVVEKSERLTAGIDEKTLQLLASGLIKILDIALSGPIHISVLINTFFLLTALTKTDVWVSDHWQELKELPIFTEVDFSQVSFGGDSVGKNADQKKDASNR